MGLVEELSSDMTGKQRRFLRGLGHDLNALVLVGQKGISDGLIENLNEQLLAHELVKVKVHDPDGIDDIARELASGTSSSLVQWIGKTLLFYRPHPDKPTIKLPR